MNRFEAGKKYWYRNGFDEIQEVVAVKVDDHTVRFNSDHEIKFSEQNNCELVELSDTPLVLIWASNQI